jgi:hypothetical protein
MKATALRLPVKVVASMGLFAILFFLILFVRLVAILAVASVFRGYVYQDPVLMIGASQTIVLRPHMNATAIPATAHPATATIQITGATVRESVVQVLRVAVVTVLDIQPTARHIRM